MKPTIGRIVHVVIDTQGSHRPAMIVRVREGTTVEVQVAYSCFDQKYIGANATEINNIANCAYDETAKVRWTWHWPEREPD